MYYVRVVDDEMIFPYSIYMLRKDFPFTSFSGLTLVDVDQDFLKENSIFAVQIQPLPQFDAMSERLSELYVKEEDGKYLGVYDVVPLTEEEVQFKVEDKKRSIKQKRDSLLLSSDWTQLSDTPVDREAWRVYRQALRDITKQEGYPLNVVWPTAP